MSRAAASLLIALTVCSCGGAHPPPDTSPTNATGVVGGRLVMPANADRNTTASRVTVAGTRVSAAIDGFGAFVLPNVPAGPLALQFSGNGLEAHADAGDIAGGETVTLNVRMDGDALRIDSIARVRGDDATIEGVIEAAGDALPANTIIVSGRSVQMPEGRGAGLTPGVRVRVTGTVSAAGIVARELVIL